MKFEISRLKVKEGKIYRGWIVDNRVDHDKLYIYVELDKCPGTRFLKVVPIDLNPQSLFVKLANNLQIIDEDGFIETDYLHEIAVRANLRKANDSRYYINHLELDEAYYAQFKDENENAEEDEIFYEGIEE